MNEQHEKPDRERWWEYYYVRYFVGTIYAVPLLYVLEHQLPQASSWLNDKWINSSLLVTAGLAYCYIASAPILLLHALRTRIIWPQNSFRKTGAYLAGGIGILVALTICNVWWEWLLAVPAILIVVLQLYALIRLELISVGSQSESHIGESYAKLATARAPRQPYTAAREYVESYKHLREHGNAMGILVLETLFALALLSVARFRSCQLDKAAIIWFVVVAVWVMPATFAWFAGTWIEARPGAWKIDPPQEGSGHAEKGLCGSVNLSANVPACVSCAGMTSYD